MTEPATVSPLQQRHNMTAGVASGMLVRLFSALTDPSLVLPWFVSQLGASPFVIGLLVPIANGGWFLPQLFVLRLMRNRPRKMPLYRAMAVVRVVCWALLTASVFIIGDRRPGLLLFLFMLFYTAFSLGAGVAGLPFMDIVGKAIPPRERGLFFAWREFTGGLLALVGSALVRYVLDARHGVAFPGNFGLLFALGGVAAVVSYIAFILVKEPDEPLGLGVDDVHPSLRTIVALLRRDHNYAVFVGARILALTATVSLPFYSVFAMNALGAPLAMAGTYLAAYTLAGLGSTLLWGRLSRSQGNRAVVVWATLLWIPLPVLPLLGPHISHQAFTLAFVILGAGVIGADVGFLSLLLDIAPATERPLYVGLINTVLGVVCLLLVAGGWVVQQWGMNALFVLSLVCAAAALACVLRVRDPARAEVSDSSIDDPTLA